MAGQGGLKDQRSSRGPGLKFKEFQELPNCELRGSTW
jgi:hypothetical protein